MSKAMPGFTPLHRQVSFAVGDEHARRIMWLVRLYCRLFRVGAGQQINLEYNR